MTISSVAFIASEYPPNIFGGLGTTVGALSTSLAMRGVRVSILVPSAPGYAATPPGVELFPVSVDGAISDEDYWLTFCEAAIRAAIEAKLTTDIVHCHDWMTTLAGMALGRATGAPVLVTVHLPQASKPNRTLEDLGLAGCAAVLVNSESVRMDLESRSVTTKNAIQVIPNGVDLQQFSTEGRAPHQHHVLFVGRLVQQKGVDVLLRAFGALLHKFPRAELTIAGDGDQRLYLERLARFLGCRDRVSFVGWQSRSRLAELYRTASVTAVPSLYEPFGLVLLEAMASGCPVVASRVGGLEETMGDGSSGYCVEPGDHLDLASRLAMLLSDSELSQEKGSAARKRAESYSWDEVARRTIELYRSLHHKISEGSQESSRGRAIIEDLVADESDEFRRRAGALLRVNPTLDDSDALAASTVD